MRFSFNGEVIKKSLNIEDNKANRNLANTQIVPQLILKVSTGEFYETQNEKIKVPTVDEFFKISFKIHKVERRELTQKRYVRLYELHIKPYFGNKKLDKIKASDIALWQNKLLDKLSSKSVKGIRTIFRTVVDDALCDEIINRNPFDLVKAPRHENVKIMNPFNIEEIDQILKYAKDNIRAFFALGFYTGMRTGELIGLKWSDINFEERTISVQRSIRQGIETLPKTKSSIREVEILDKLLPFLIKHYEITECKSGYVFETYKGVNFTTSDKISVHYWKPLLISLGLVYRNLYQMRHTFASMMISHGEDILWVSNMLGHKHSSMTLDHYAKYVKNDKKVRGSFL